MKTRAIKSKLSPQEQKKEVYSSSSTEHISSLLNFFSSISQDSSEKIVLAISFMSLIAFLATGIIGLLVFYIRGS